MKTVLVSTLAAAAVALSMSSAFALSNSPEGRVVVDTNAPAITSQEQAAPRHFLSGDQQADPDFGQSSNAIQGRDFLNAQKGRY
jgi:hypothetical protein